MSPIKKKIIKKKIIKKKNTCSKNFTRKDHVKKMMGVKSNKNIEQLITLVTKTKQILKKIVQSKNPKEYSIVTYSKKIGKNTKDFTAKDMVNYYKWLEKQEIKKPKKKKITKKVKKIKRFKKNPSKDYTGPIIYDKIIAIEAEKGIDSNFPKELFRHDFKKNKTAAKIIGLSDGSLLIKSTKGKRLWKNFKYNK